MVRRNPTALWRSETVWTYGEFGLSLGQSIACRAARYLEVGIWSDCQRSLLDLAGGQGKGRGGQREQGGKFGDVHCDSVEATGWVPEV